MQLKYPVGVETFEKVITEGYAYVDKSEVVYNLTQAGQFFFLSRPRRFGKSLLISTLEAYFEGRRELFDGLWLGSAEGVDWTPHAVLRLNFVDAAATVRGLNSVLEYQIDKWERKYGLTRESSLDYGQRFMRVIETAYAATGRRVVVLIDEYDKVLTNTLRDPELHHELKTILKPVFAVLKGADRYIRFAMLTGVSRFSKLSIFSDINNLQDITLDERFCTICGITEDELKVGFKQGIQDFADARGISFDDMVQILKDNYDGYHFSENCPDIYNPYSLIISLDTKKIQHRWFESGTPTFLLEHISGSEEDLREFLAPVVSNRMLSNTSITDSNLVSVLYQTGYLTIKHYNPEEDTFTLGIPNREVEIGMLENLLPYYNGRDIIANDNMLRRLRRFVLKGEPEAFLKSLQSFLAAIPQHLSEKKPEIYYENNLYLILSLIGFEIRTEEETSDGRIDAVMKTPNYIYVIELKLNGTAEDAIEQIHRKQYALPYATDPRRLILLGVSLSKQTRTLDGWLIE